MHFQASKEMRESDALILILIPKYRHFKRWNAIIKNMAQGMSNTYTVTHYLYFQILSISIFCLQCIKYISIGILH